ncbi:MAG: SpoIIE family protein phosphatase [Cyanobacteria bacterium]|jgi:serine/threonine protein phosphatase PrpC|nr:SpoIIE family protein phosphatase [Cyanobacteria bacterium GSL.Bin21]
MDEAQKTLRCSLKYCQTLNPISSEVCYRCQTPLIQRYLWVLGTPFPPEQIQELVAKRYLVISEKLVLDTQPGIAPDFPDSIPSELKPYLRLSPYRLHVPKLYGQIPTPELTHHRPGKAQHSPQSELWLLEYENFSSAVQNQLATGEFLPALEATWKAASGARQLNWLLQMSQLWQPLQVQGVATTLISPECLRVNGSVVQLQELAADQTTVTLQNLGQLWSNWLDNSDQTIRSFLQDICQRLQQGKLQSSKELTYLLETALSEVARSQPRLYQIATTTDSGPTRSHNEDAYYQHNNTQDPSPPHHALAIVCDGVGGHQGGEVASHLAIDQLRQEVQKLPDLSTDSRVLTEQIEQAVSTVNDMICEQNDAEHRQAQERMGTTLVMALAHNHEMYITHVGDSRVYWITSYGCYQLTLDDDFASRQTRLGHSLYREALQQPAAGSLIQALGMSPSKLLHPTTQRLVIDEDCILLLCSDGLSDNGLVEQYWEAEILPALDKETDLDTVAQQLIELANHLNGHDNVTVSLLKCSVSDSQNPQPLKVDCIASPPPEASEEKTARVKNKPAHPWQEAIVLLLIVACVMGGIGIAYWFFPEVRNGLDEFQEQLRSKPIRDPSELPSPQ